MKGIVLTAGIGTRLYPITQFINKNLLPVGNKPMFLHPLQTLIDSGITEIAVVIGPPHGKQIKQILKDISLPKTVKIVCINQPEPKGMSDAIGRCRKFVNNHNVMVVGGDNIFGDNFIKEVATFMDGAISFLRNVPDPQRFGVPVYDDKNKLIKIEEKPKYPKTNWIVSGPIILDNKAFDFIDKLKPSPRGELEITDLYSFYIKDNKLRLIKRKDFWIDAGTFESLAEANHYLFKKNR